MIQPRDHVTEGTMVTINCCSFSINMAMGQPEVDSSIKLVTDGFGISICFFPYHLSTCSAFIMILVVPKRLLHEGFYF